jgi:hypothetical protein
MAVKITNKRAILLTGTIIPNSVYTNYLDANLRLQDYLKAIEFYCNTFKNGDVYFLENSEFNLTSNEDFNQLKLRYKFDLLKFPKSERFYEGKGYQEFEMLDGAVEQLKEKYDVFVKVTGRYIVTNAAEITNIECNGMIVDLHKKYKKAQTYIMCFTKDFYLANIKGEYKNVNDNEGRFIEKVIYSKIESKNLFNKCALFVKTPLMQGISGSYSITLKRNSIKVFIRNIERIIYRVFKVKTFYY